VEVEGKRVPVRSRGRRRQGCEVYKETLHVGQHIMFETALVSKTGKKIPVEVNTRVMDLEGKVVY
jgi:hypothetical protein